MSRSSILPSIERVAPVDAARGWSAGSRRCRRSSSRGRPRCAWRWRSRPRATAARPSPSRADTCARDRRCGRYPRRRDCRRRAASPSSSASALGGLLGLLALDDVDADLGEHRHRVLDLLGGHLLRRQRRVQLVIGDVAALLAAGDHLLDRRRHRVEERRLRRFLATFGTSAVLAALLAMSVPPCNTAQPRTNAMLKQGPAVTYCLNFHLSPGIAAIIPRRNLRASDRDPLI